MIATANMNMQLDTWRGYSAYEIAVKNGFEGSEQEWLDSLKGEPGANAEAITVNYKGAVDGNITVRGTDIYIKAGSATTVAQALDGKADKDLVENTLDSTAVDKALSAAKGQELNATKAAVYGFPITIPTDGWTGEGPYTQDIAAEKVVEDESSCHLVFGFTPGSKDAFSDSGAQIIAQGSSKVTVQVDSIPAEAFTANLIVIRQGVVV